MKVKLSKQTANEFLAFKGVFNQELYKAIQDQDFNAIIQILNETYQDEMNNNFYVKTEINPLIIKQYLDEHCKEIDNDPSLNYKL